MIKEGRVSLLKKSKKGMSKVLKGYHFGRMKTISKIKINWFIADNIKPFVEQKQNLKYCILCLINN